MLTKLSTTSSPYYPTVSEATPVLTTKRFGWVLAKELFVSSTPSDHEIDRMKAKASK